MISLTFYSLLLLSLILIIVSITTPCSATEPLEKRLRCKNEDILIIPDLSKMEREFERHPVEISNTDNFIPREIMRNVCKIWEEGQDQISTRHRRGVLENIGYVFLKPLFLFLFKQNFNNWVEFRKAFTVIVDGKPARDKSGEFFESLRRILFNNKLDGVLLERSTKIFRAHGHKHKDTVVGRNMFVDNVYCYHHGENDYSLNFDIVFPRPQYMISVQTCGDTGFTHRGKYHYFEFKELIFKNINGVYHMPKSACVRKNILVCPLESIEQAECSMQDTFGCHLKGFPLSSSSKIVRKLPTGYLIYGGIGHFTKKRKLQNSESEFIERIDINPFSLIFIEPGVGDEIHYGGKILTGDGIITKWEEL